jgi:CNT family concentrative nucleoside transporter
MIAKLGLKALLAGSLSNLMSAALAGLILSATGTQVAAPPPAAPAAVTAPAPAPAASAQVNQVNAQ